MFKCSVILVMNLSPEEHYSTVVETLAVNVFLSPLRLSCWQTNQLLGPGGMDYSGCDSHLDQLHWASRLLCLHLATDDTCNEMSMAVLLVDSGDGLFLHLLDYTLCLCRCVMHLYICNYGFN